MDTTNSIIILIKIILCEFLIVILISAQCSVPPTWKKPIECCNYPLFINSNITEQCRVQYNAVVKPSAGAFAGHLLHGTCYFECMFNQTGILANGHLNSDKLRLVFSSALNSDLSLLNVLNKSFDICISQPNNRALEFGKIFSTGLNNVPECSPISAFLFICLNLYMIRDCPPKRFMSGDESCVAIKQYVTNCPFGLQRY